jgi:hypothetical protein
MSIIRSLLGLGFWGYICMFIASRKDSYLFIDID